VRAGIDDTVGFEIVRQYRLLLLPPKANCRIAMPGRPVSRRSFRAEGESSPRSSAMIFASGNARWIDLNKRGRGLASTGLSGRSWPDTESPVIGKAAEMVDPNHVVELEGCAHPGLPPRETVGGMHIPTVERIAPKLAVLGEIIRRHTSDGQRPARTFIEFKKMRCRPGVRAVHGHEDWNVADDLQPPARGRCPYPAPLPEEQILGERVRRHRLL